MDYGDGGHRVSSIDDQITDEFYDSHHQVKVHPSFFLVYIRRINNINASKLTMHWHFFPLLQYYTFLALSSFLFRGTILLP